MVRRELVIVASVGLASPAFSAPSISGRWLADLSSQKLPDHPDVYLVANGRYECRSCSPPRSYAADGKPHVIPGDEEVHSESVTILGPRSIRTRIVSPSLLRETTMIVSRDDQSAMYVSLDHRPGIAGMLRTRYLAHRVAPAPQGANLVSGSWQGVAYLEVPREVRTIELKLAGNRFLYRTPTGVRYSARLDGEAVPVHGPYAGKITASVRRLHPGTWVESRERDGKPLLKRTYRLSSDGSALQVSTTDLSNNTTFSATYHRD